MTSVSLSKSTYAYSIQTNLYAIHVMKTSLNFYLYYRFFHAGTGVAGISFLLKEVFHTLQAMATLDLFFLMEVFFLSASHADPPIMGASDMSQGYLLVLLAHICPNIRTWA